MLSVEHLTKKFGGTTAVDDVDFTIHPGEIFAMIGPNGSGKTTIVKTIAGLLRPTDGRILVNGIDVSENPVAAKAVIGYIPDDPVVWPAMTGEEFLHFSGALWGLDEKTRAARIPKLLSLFDLAQAASGRFEDYSRGNKQKFSIIAALLHRPKVLLVDEPIVGLDPESAEIAERAFFDFAARGGAVLLVTHTLPVAEAIASTIGILSGGRLVASGTIDQLKKQAKLGKKKTAHLDAVYKALT